MVTKKEKECRKCGDELVLDETPKLKINGKDVGINDLDEIMNEVMALGLKDETAIGRELLSRVKANDFVPRSVEKEYERALLEEYNRRSR
ncbi:MAG: hypothetical protein HPY73_00380 [Methanomassiliicoccales archaeon]|nr:MAG: hypothetical protein HPY73_00380 [Methanomassiliicoccales archaeon]